MALLTEIFKRAPFCGAFLLLSPIIIPAFCYAESCTPCHSGLIAVDAVYDGDTLRLEDGRRIRLIGVNTPELGQGAPDQPDAVEAKQLLERLVERSDSAIRICMDAEQRDRYGRQLAHLYDRHGNSINRELLIQGVGYQIAVPPNLRNHGCYKDAEREARKGEKGVWRHPIKAASELNGNETGFHILYGQITRVGQSRGAVWLNLGGGLAIRITWDDWQRFGIDDPLSLRDTTLEVRGWIYHRHGNQRIRVRHPSSIVYRAQSWKGGHE
jgi:endonuclease YncB( thermonuclease family)